MEDSSYSQSNGVSNSAPTALSIKIAEVKILSQLSRPYLLHLCSYILFPAPSHIGALPEAGLAPFSLHSLCLVIQSSLYSNGISSKTQFPNQVSPLASPSQTTLLSPYTTGFTSSQQSIIKSIISSFGSSHL